jgi:hypothetical protein
MSKFERSLVFDCDPQNVAVHTPRNRIKRFAQFGLSRGLSDRPRGDSESRPARREKLTALSQANKKKVDARFVVAQADKLSAVHSVTELFSMPIARSSQP